MLSWEPYCRYHSLWSANTGPGIAVMTFGCPEDSILRLESLPLRTQSELGLLAGFVPGQFMIHPSNRF